VPRPNLLGGEPLAEPGPAFPLSGNAADAESLNRRAEMIADGRLPFPTEAHHLERDRLLALVRGQLRERLLTLLARAVARDIRDRVQE
jgi:hypothetical protein